MAASDAGPRSSSTCRSATEAGPRAAVGCGSPGAALAMLRAAPFRNTAAGGAARAGGAPFRNTAEGGAGPAAGAPFRNTAEGGAVGRVSARPRSSKRAAPPGAVGRPASAANTATSGIAEGGRPNTGVRTQGRGPGPRRGEAGEAGDREAPAGDRLTRVTPGTLVASAASGEPAGRQSEQAQHDPRCQQERRADGQRRGSRARWLGDWRRGRGRGRAGGRHVGLAGP